MKMEKFFKSLKAEEVAEAILVSNLLLIDVQKLQKMVNQARKNV